MTGHNLGGAPLGFTSAVDGFLSRAPAVPRRLGRVYGAAMREADTGAAGRRRRARLIVATALALLALWVARDYLAALAWAVLIAVAAWPLHRRLVATMPARRTLSTILAGLCIAAPLALVAVEVGREAGTAVRWVAQAQQHGVPAPGWLAGVP